MMAADAPANAWAAMAHPTVGAKIIIKADAANSATTTLKMTTHPMR